MTDAERIHELSKEVSLLKRRVAELEGKMPTEEFQEREQDFGLATRLKADATLANLSGLSAVVQLLLEHVGDDELSARALQRLEKARQEAEEVINAECHEAALDEAA